MDDKINVVWKHAKVLNDDEVYRGVSIRMATRDDYSSYENHRVEIVVNSDGSICFCEDNAESFIYFYPDQLSRLKDALEVALLHRKINLPTPLRYVELATERIL